MLKTFFTQGLWLCLLIGLLSSLSYAGIDTDGLSAGVESCDGLYVSGATSGTCDSVALCDAFAGCNNTCDFDCDGVQDGVEYPGADPTTPAVALPDTDGDGIFDPCDLDDDGDTVPDQTAPVALTCPNAATYGVPATPDNCPLVVNPDQTDTDFDGIGDACEEPLISDSDADGLDDSVETDTGVFVDANNTGSHPNLADTDGDNLLDGDEVNNYATDPNKADTDGDGIRDDIELNIVGTNPTQIDTDAEGVHDNADAFPLDPDRTAFCCNNAPCPVGDVNFDGLVNWNDVMAVYWHVTGSTPLSSCE